MNVDGSALRRLTDDRLNAARPDWSPDGSLIVFNSNDALDRIRDSEVYVIAPDGTDLRQLTDEANAAAIRPVWSPYGNWILFTHFAYPGDLTRSFDLYVMRADGADHRWVTNTPDIAENAGDWTT